VQLGERQTVPKDAQAGMLAVHAAGLARSKLCQEGLLCLAVRDRQQRQELRPPASDLGNGRLIAQPGADIAAQINARRKPQQPEDALLDGLEVRQPAGHRLGGPELVRFAVQVDVEVGAGVGWNEDDRVVGRRTALGGRGIAGQPGHGHEAKQGIERQHQRNQSSPPQHGGGRQAAGGNPVAAQPPPGPAGTPAEVLRQLGEALDHRMASPSRPAPAAWRRPERRDRGTKSITIGTPSSP
jgi:hypothetical protein